MTHTIEETKPLAGVVLYYPPPEAAELIVELISQGCDIISVVNACRSDKDRAFYAKHSAKCIINSENIGLASALNAIITYFLDSSYTHLFLFDQDSMPDSEFINTMLMKHLSLTSTSSNIACLAPSIHDTRLEDFAHRHPKTSLADTTVDSVITSGCLFTKDSLRTNGPMDDALFIDGIDHEWCLRAQAKGLKIHLCQNAILRHKLGDRAIALGTSRKFMHSNPARHYYIIRNSLYLARKPYIPKRWRLIEMLKTVRRAVAYPLFSPSPGLSLQMVALGLIHGFQGRMGKLKCFPH